ncbi:histidine kinase [Streptomyces sp. CAU 1734]|uniref:sensor histidine kinase n=1 Tax=Streptomyces sp. CAU 1734 TaxID=3140360 RepID=UPI0032610C5A
MTFPRPHRSDALLCTAALLVGVLLWSLGLHTNAGRGTLPGWTVLVPLAAICVSEMFRRSLPMTNLLIGTCALTADQFTAGSVVTMIAFTDVVYSAVFYGTAAQARRIVVVSVLFTIAATITLLVYFQSAEVLLLGVIIAAVTIGSAFTGAITRNHREAAEAARLRAEQTALLAEMDRVQAVVAERGRMARELHDMVANHLSAIAIHSTAALSIGNPETSREALGVIRENSVAGLAEMRRLIGLLRDGADDHEPAVAPTLEGLDALIARAGANGGRSGLVFTLDDRRGDGQPLPAPVEMAAYRIVQESLTNALKHADPGEVRTTLAHTAGEPLTVTVTSVFGSRPGPRAPGSGAGLTGIRERVALLNGRVSAGVEAGPPGGPEKIWRVAAELPVRDETESAA